MKKSIRFALAVGAAMIFASCGVGGETPSGEQDETVKMQYYASSSDLVRALKSGEETVGLLAEPTISALLNAKEEFSATLSLAEIYGAYPQDVVIAKKSVIEQDGAFVYSIAEGIRQGAGWLKNNAHDAVEQVNHNLFNKTSPALDNNITSETIARCGISFQKATDAKASVKNYLESLNSEQANFTAIPSDAFFYDGLSQTQNEEGVYTVVAPDGVPALALAQLMYYDRLANGVGREVQYKVVEPSKIGEFVENENVEELGDVVVLPLLQAVALVGDGSAYQMVGVATQSNYYFVSNQTLASANDLKGKRIGVVGENSAIDFTLRYGLLKKQLVYKKAG